MYLKMYLWKKNQGYKDKDKWGKKHKRINQHCFLDQNSYTALTSCPVYFIQDHLGVEISSLDTHVELHKEVL